MASMLVSPTSFGALGSMRKRSRESDKVVNAAFPGSVHLPSPTPKETDIAYGVATTRGGRVYMEDFHNVVTSGSLENKLKGHSFFVVADGHGGSDVAEFLTQNLYNCLTGDLPKKGAALDSTEQLAEAMSDAILAIDDQLDAMSSHECGSTALAALVSNSSLILASSGDSRAVLSRGGHAIALTDDHSPEREDEQQRIAAAGGILMHNNGLRVMGVLAMTRALGDKVLRKYGVIPNPDICSVPIDESDEFLILASDGLWSAVSNQDAVNIARQSIARAESQGASRDMASRVAARVLMRTAMHLGSRDNITIIVVDLNQLTTMPDDTLAAAVVGNTPSPVSTDRGEADSPTTPDSQASDQQPAQPSNEIVHHDNESQMETARAKLKRACHARLPSASHLASPQGPWPSLCSAEELMVFINSCSC